MNSVQLLAHFDRISDAPDAVPRLRSLIFRLAARGRLVCQDRNDEPALALVKRLQTEKTRLMGNGKGGKQELLAAARENSIPFEVPKHWAWLPLSHVGLLSGGMTPSMSRGDFWDGDINWFSPKDIKSDELLESELKITRAGVDETGLQIYRPGCLFMVARSGILKRTFPIAINRVEATANQDLKVLTPFVDGLERYLQTMLRGMTDFILTALVKTGTTVQSLKYEEFAWQPLPLPPLNEQLRIVAKVDELMALCDRLEAAQAERETRRARVAAASLYRLNQPAAPGDAQAFREHASFHLQHLPRLTTRPEHIKQLRQTILDLAVRGQLTRFWRETTEIREPAQGYLKSILEVRKRRWDGKRGARTNRKYPEPTEHDSDNLPVIPDSWVWASGDAVCTQITDGEHIQPPYQREGFPMLTAKHVRDGYVTFDGCELISEPDFRKCEARCKPEHGDILVVSVGATTGRAAIVNASRPFVLVRSVLLLKPLILAQFFLRWLQGPWCFEWMRHASEASAQPHLYIGDTKRMPVPIPPLVEQLRIVAEVDELMALCDRLEAQLSTAQSERRRLLESVLHHALKGEFQAA